MAKSGSQTTKGNAFEYACITTLHDSLCKVCSVVIEGNTHYHEVKEAFSHIHVLEQENMLKAGKAGARLLIQYEPRLSNDDGCFPLVLKLNQDSSGESGDVRDVICCREESKWEIGVSCKHNHDAVKHNRLSLKIDFGEKWLKHKCSEQYWKAVRPVFEKIQKLGENGHVWSEYLSPNTRKNEFYIPILKAFVEEFRRLAENYQDVPRNFVHYMVGERDFYKIISDDSKKYTKMEVANFNGTLNQKSKNVKSIVAVKTLPLPTRMIEISYSNDKELRDTVKLVFDCGWSFSMRIHNAESKMKNSLKFDITIEGYPKELYSTNEPW